MGLRVVYIFGPSGNRNGPPNPRTRAYIFGVFDVLGISTAGNGPTLFPNSRSSRRSGGHSLASSDDDTNLGNWSVRQPGGRVRRLKDSTTGIRGG